MFLQGWGVTSSLWQQAEDLTPLTLLSTAHRRVAKDLLATQRELLVEVKARGQMLLQQRAPVSQGGGETSTTEGAELCGWQQPEATCHGGPL